MPAAEKDELDELMPDPEEQGGTSDELEIVIADDDNADTGGVPGSEVHEEDESEDKGAKAEDEDEENADLKGDSKSVRERIMRERRLRKRQVESERVARAAAEAKLEAAQAETIEARIVATNMITRGLESEITSLTERLTAAKEGGKTADEIKLQSQLTDAQANLREAKQNQVKLEEQKKAPKKPETNPYADTWVGANTWFNDAEFSAEAAAVHAIDKKLTAENKFNARSAQYFEELDKRVHAKLPHLRAEVRKAGLKMSFGDEKGGRQEQRRDPARPSAALPARERSASSGAPKSKTKVVLTKDDLTNMATFKLDPTNPAHLQQYAREKMSQGD